MFWKPCVVRKRSSSSSGLTPGSTRRNVFNTSSSSNTIDEFDCSTPIGRTSGSAGGCAPSAQKKLSVLPPARATDESCIRPRISRA